MVQSLWKTVVPCLKKLKIESLCDPAIPFSVVYLKELKAKITDTLTPTGYLWENEGKYNVTLQEFA